MPRIARLVVPGIAHHITQRGNNKQTIFEEDFDFLKYCRWINKYARIYDLKILAYCLMPNHVHFIAIPKDEESLSKTFQLTHMQYARYMHKKRGACGHFWQNRFYSCPMDEGHLYRAIRYVERNPVRSQLTKNAWDYFWSSARWHIGISAKSNIFLSSINIAPKKEWVEYLCENDVEFEKNLKKTTLIGEVIGRPFNVG